MTVAIPLDLMDALRTLENENLGDWVYWVRDREGLGWEGPRVTKFSAAASTIAFYVKEYNATMPKLEGLDEA